MAKQSNTDKLIFYREYRDSFIHARDIEVHQSEQRIRFFLALVTGIGAFIGVLGSYKVTCKDFFDPTMVTLIALPILVVYGILTFSQIMWSSHVIHNFNVNIKYLGDQITNLDPNLKKGFEKVDRRDDSNIFILSHIKGTFAQYMYLTEGLLIAGFIILFGFKYYPNCLNIFYFIAAVFFLMTVALIIVWSNHIKNGIKNKYYNSA